MPRPQDQPAHPAPPPRPAAGRPYGPPQQRPDTAHAGPRSAQPPPWPANPPPPAAGQVPAPPPQRPWPPQYPRAAGPPAAPPAPGGPPPHAYPAPPPPVAPSTPPGAPAEAHRNQPPRAATRALEYDTDPYVDDAWDEPIAEPPARPRRRPRHGSYEDDYDEPPPPRRDSSPVEYQRERDRRHDRATTIATVIRLVSGFAVLIFVLHIVFALFGANSANGVVSFVYQAARVLVLGFGDVFTPGSATIGLVLNYGLAAAVYLVVGRLLARAIQRR